MIRKNQLPPLPNLDIKKKEVSKEQTKKEDDKKKNQLPPLPNLDIKKKKYLKSH